MISRILFVAVAAIALAHVAHGAHYKTRGGPVKGKLNVHLVPHTHNDVGWLKTVDQYFYGANNTIQNAGVQYILDTVIAGLQQNPDRLFNYVETGFFARWYREQTNATKAIVQTLVDDKQLVFLNGGWAMHDEANPHYHSMVDQTTYGHEFLLNNLGPNAIPNVGWQIDPFGHSGTQAALLCAETGFDSLYFARNDYQDYQERFAASTLETVWQGSPSLGSAARVFTGVFYQNTYCMPPGFNFDVFSNDPPVQDDPRLEDVNIQARVDDFVAWAQSQAAGFTTDNIMFTMGCDFQYMDAFTWFKNLDKIIHWVNLDGRVNTFYSTPDIYTQSKYDANTTWTLKTDDYMPIANDQNSYWTGFFTSRPTLKRWSRHNVQYYPLIRQIAAAANNTDEPVWGDLLDAIGLSSHHDAITGTEKQHVAFDYARHLSDGRASVLKTVSTSIDTVLGADSNGNWQECVLANVSVCPFTQTLGVTNTSSGSVRVVLWNPSSQARVQTIRIPIGGPYVTVAGPNGVAVFAEVVPASVSVTNYGPGNGSAYTLIFTAQISQMGWAVYTITNIDDNDTGLDSSRTRFVAPQKPKANEDIILNNGVYELTFSGLGQLQFIRNLVDGSSTTLTQEWLYYLAADNPGQRMSGAYVFRPNGTSTYPVGSAIVNDQVVNGQLVTSVRQTFGPWVQQTIRLYRNSSLIEIEYTVGPIDVSDGKGKEIISRFSTGVDSQAQWWVDSNGRDMQYRRRNWRQSYNITVAEPISANYFPTVTHAFINDSRTQFTVYTETSQASGSIFDGSLEFLAHRRLLHDDGYGVGEPLNETQFVTGYSDPCPQIGCGAHYGPGLIHRSRYWISLNQVQQAARTYRPALDQIFYDTQNFYSTNTGAIKLGQGSIMAVALPDNLQVMTLERKNATTILLRLSHQYGVGEDPEMSQPATVDLARLFSAPGLQYVSFIEMSLTGNQLKSNLKPLQWQIRGEDGVPMMKRPADAGSVVTLTAMQVRTFFVTVA